MKKLILITIVACVLTGCEPNMSKVENEDEEVVSTRRFNYDDHVYIEFYRQRDLYDNNTGYVHDPKCLKRDIEAILEAHKQ